MLSSWAWGDDLDLGEACLPSGDVDNRDTLCHVLNSLYKNEYDECFFYDSANGIHLHNVCANLTDIDLKDKPLVLKLENGSDDRSEREMAQWLTKVIGENASDPILEDVKERLARAHQVNKDSIVIKHVFIGSLNFVYTVADLIFKTAKTLSERLKEQFKTFLALKIHPLLFRPTFDVAHYVRSEGVGKV